MIHCIWWHMTHNDTIMYDIVYTMTHDIVIQWYNGTEHDDTWHDPGGRGGCSLADRKHISCLVNCTLANITTSSPYHLTINKLSQYHNTNIKLSQYHHTIQSTHWQLSQYHQTMLLTNYHSITPLLTDYQCHQCTLGQKQGAEGHK